MFDRTAQDRRSGHGDVAAQALRPAPVRAVSSCLADISVRLAASPEEVRAAQRVRYQVFYEEGGAIPDAVAAMERRDVDVFDDVAEHLIVIDKQRAAAGNNHGVVGNYRLLRNKGSARACEFYSSGEFDLGVLLNAELRFLELGRSCVLREYRQKPVIGLLWSAIARYVAEHRIELLFGCASFRGTDPALIEEQLAYLHHHHSAPARWRPHAIGAEVVAMDRRALDEIDAVRAFKRMEPLIRGYLRAGAMVGRGAHIDRRFNSIDVCIVLPMADLSARYLRHFGSEGNPVGGRRTEFPSPMKADIAVSIL